MLLPETLNLHRRELFDFHYIYFLPWKDQMAKAIQDNGGKVTCFPANNNILLMLKAAHVAAYVKANRIDLIHAHLPWAGILARVVSKLTGVPVIYTEHNKQERYHFLTRRMNLATIGMSTEVVAVSEDVAASIRQRRRGRKVRLRTILNGVNIDRFSPGLFSGSDVRKSLGISPDAPIIGTIAVFRLQKRLDVWLQIAKSISQQVPEARFVIVGDGPLRNSLSLKAKDLGLEHVVIFAGLQVEVRPYLAAFDLYMMTSVFEGLPVAMLEAMAFGCPVITTDAGGIKEVIRHEQEGLICSVEQPERLVDFAKELIDNPQKRHLLGIQGRKRVVEKFSLAAMVKTLEMRYEQLAGQNAAVV